MPSPSYSSKPSSASRSSRRRHPIDSSNVSPTTPPPPLVFPSSSSSSSFSSPFNNTNSSNANRRLPNPNVSSPIQQPFSPISSKLRIHEPISNENIVTISETNLSKENKTAVSFDENNPQINSTGGLRRKRSSEDAFLHHKIILDDDKNLETVKSADGEQEEWENVILEQCRCFCEQFEFARAKTLLLKNMHRSDRVALCLADHLARYWGKAGQVVALKILRQLAMKDDVVIPEALVQHCLHSLPQLCWCGFEPQTQSSKNPPEEELVSLKDFKIDDDPLLLLCFPDALAEYLVQLAEEGSPGALLKLYTLTQSILDIDLGACDTASPEGHYYNNNAVVRVQWLAVGLYSGVSGMSASEERRFLRMAAFGSSVDNPPILKKPDGSHSSTFNSSFALPRWLWIAFERLAECLCRGGEHEQALAIHRYLLDIHHFHALRRRRKNGLMISSNEQLGCKAGVFDKKQVLACAQEHLHLRSPHKAHRLLSNTSLFNHESNNTLVVMESMENEKEAMVFAQLALQTKNASLALSLLNNLISDRDHVLLDKIYWDALCILSQINLRAVNYGDERLKKICTQNGLLQAFDQSSKLYSDKPGNKSDNDDNDEMLMDSDD